MRAGWLRIGCGDIVRRVSGAYMCDIYWLADMCALYVDSISATSSCQASRSNLSWAYDGYVFEDTSIAIHEFNNTHTRPYLNLYVDSHICVYIHTHIFYIYIYIYLLDVSNIVQRSKRIKLGFSKVSHQYTIYNNGLNQTTS